MILRHPCPHLRITILATVLALASGSFCYAQSTSATSASPNAGVAPAAPNSSRQPSTGAVPSNAPSAAGTAAVASPISVSGAPYAPVVTTVIAPGADAPAGTATAPPTITKTIRTPEAAKPQPASAPMPAGTDFVVLTALEETPGEVFYLTRATDAWVASRSGDERLPGVEKIRINLANRTLQLATRPPAEISEAEKERLASLKAGAFAESWECFSGIGGTNTNRAQSGYTICTSEMTKIVNDVGDKVVGSIGLLLGNNRNRVAVDGEKLIAAVRSSSLVTLLEKEKEAARLAAEDAARKLAETNRYQLYRKRYETAVTADEMRQWLKDYERADPDKLREVVEIKLSRLEQIEAEQEKKRAEEKRKQMAEQAAQLEKNAREWEERQQQLVAKVKEFRRTLKVEMETNCGPILEIKGSLIKVYRAVATFGNEHWIRRDRTFPPGYECRFINGLYEPPTL